MNVDKKVSTTSAILIIIIVAALAGGVFYWQYNKTKELKNMKNNSISFNAKLSSLENPQNEELRVEDYNKQSTCEEAGYYWHNNSCHEKPQPEPEPEPEPELEPESESEPEPETEKETAEEKLSIKDKVVDWGYHVPESPRPIDTIVLHSSYNVLGGDVHSVEKVIKQYKMYGVTSHYLISRDGTIYKLAPEKAVAYHAGISEMPDGRTGVNEFSIGIEHINAKEEAPTKAQYQSSAQLTEHLQEKYNIPSDNIVGHAEIAPERKSDPWNFNWDTFFNFLD